jgi:hypothetical protein
MTLLESLDVRKRVTLVVHDWGSGLGFDWDRAMLASASMNSFSASVLFGGMGR